MKKKKSNSPFVFSTHPDCLKEVEEESKVTIHPAEQKLRLWLETKHRGGKIATVITDFIGDDQSINDLAKRIKSLCGTGGSAKDGEIIIQGNHRDKILEWLLKQGYTKTKKAGG